jgi:hypothetical protein
MVVTGAIYTEYETDKTSSDNRADQLISSRNYGG